MNLNFKSIRKISYLAVASITLHSCTEEVYFNITVPAPVTIPAYVKNVGIINRSIISDSNKVRKEIDDVLSAKSAKLDSDCSNECIRGLKDALSQTNDYSKIAVLNSLHFINSYPDIFPPPLSWGEIEDICRRNNVDVLFSLEMFHTDTRVRVMQAAQGVLSGGIMGLANNTTAGTKVNTGWRIYDPRDKLILDGYNLGQGLTFQGNFLNPRDAAYGLMDHKQVVMNTSYQLGQNYASRTIPAIIRVSREFYIRGNRDFKIARRMADAGDWNGAAAIWERETGNPKWRKRAKAYYNMGIISEMNGKVDSAISCVQKSYEIGGRQLALDYLNILQYRAANDQVLNSQVQPK